MKTALGFLMCSPLLLLACSPTEDSPTYRRDAVAVLSRYCTDCHQSGGIAPFALTDYETVQRHAPLIRSAVEGDRMPPWKPSENGLPLRHSRKMRAEDKELLLRWIDQGTQEGGAAQTPRTDIPLAAEVAPPRPDLILDAGEVYMPDSRRTDDYRCFVLDPKLSEDVFLTAAQVRPDNKGIVHHVLIFEIAAQDVPVLMEKDQMEAGVGYTCFGGPNIGDQRRVRTVMGWAPGGVPMRTDGEVAMKINKGSVLVMQVHYNMLNFKGTGDRTTAVMELTRTPPKLISQLMPLAQPSRLKIPAGDKNARQLIAAPVSVLQAIFMLPPGDLVVLGNAPHMHMLGKRIVTQVEGGPVLLEVPSWDFHWQQGYVFQEPYALRPSDVLQVECTYDNSMENQPVINGQRQEPREVTWGEKTTDEMCLSYLSILAGTP